MLPDGLFTGALLFAAWSINPNQQWAAVAYDGVFGYVLRN